MSALNKVMEYLGLVDGPEGAAEEVKPKEVRREERVRAITPTASATPATSASSTNGVTVIGGRAHVAVDPVLDLEPSYNIVTLHPRSYSEARQMAEHYREGNPVLINLDDMDESERKRLVDFASGLAFGLRGGIEKITSRVFLLSPANVTVRTEDKAAYAQASFYNQS
jgi:cell division inhibitor SepF